MDSPSDLSSLDSPLSSAPPSSPSSRASSPLSELSKSPSPPPQFSDGMKRRRRASLPYPSPPTSQQSSQSGSPVPDPSMVSSRTTNKDGPPPAKRRRVSKENDARDSMDGNKERTPCYIDIQDGEIEKGQEAQLEKLMKVLHKRQKIVVIAGAGISVSAGIPDFRSSNGLFTSLKAEHKLKGSGKDLFDASVYKDRDSTSIFQSMVKDMSRMTKSAKPTAFHHMLATIASEGRLLRLYSQNIDGIDTSLEPLATRVPLTKDTDGKWPRTVQLHGSLDKAVCSKCNTLSDFDAELFDSADPPPCESCITINEIRTTHMGKRSHGIGLLRPRMVLYNEHNPDDEAIGAVTREDLRRRPDAVLVVGTTLKVPGVRRIVREMCNVVRDRKDRAAAVWINNDPPPAQKEFEDCWDIVVQGSCDEIAYKAAMRRWDDPELPSEAEEVSDEAAQRAAKIQGEVYLPTECAPPVNPPSALHFNNSFQQVKFLGTPKRPLSIGPDYSPLPSRGSKVISSIEFPAGDTIAVTDGLLTPTKSNRGSPPTAAASNKIVGSINDRLKDAAKVKHQANPAKGAKNKQALPSKRGPNIKYIKPKPGNKPTAAKSKKGTGTKAAPKPGKNSLSNTFGQSKGPSVVIPSAELETKIGVVNTPSKLRAVSNASLGEALEPLSPQDPRSNGSPQHKTGVSPCMDHENLGSRQKLCNLG